MEVHHPHHLGHKKKWSELLLEFLMLFTAVTLGFLAENIREHYVEKERARELIVQLKTDIKNNIHLIDSVVNRDNMFVHKFDTAVVYLITNHTIDVDSLYVNLPSNIFRFLSKNDTYEQMKSTAALRYIKDTVLLAKILKYASDCQAAETRSSNMESDYVTTEYANVINAWMPKAVAVKRIYNDRKGAFLLINKESTSSVLINDQQLHFLEPLHQFKEKTILSGEKATALKDALIPVIMRRTILLSNTVRFMGIAKESAIALLEYIEKTPE